MFSSFAEIFAEIFLGNVARNFTEFHRISELLVSNSPNFFQRFAESLQISAAVLFLLFLLFLLLWKLAENFITYSRKVISQSFG